jgi:uncharacterized protein with GYD domain
MPTFILSLNWTDQGIRGVKEAPKRSQAAKGLAKKLGVVHVCEPVMGILSNEPTRRFGRQ